MPHDKHGKKVEVGDTILAPLYNHRRTQNDQVLAVGVVVNMREGQSCSGDAEFNVHGVKRVDAFGAEECEVILKANGTLPE